MCSFVYFTLIIYNTDFVRTIEIIHCMEISTLRNSYQFASNKCERPLFIIARPTQNLALLSIRVGSIEHCMAEWLRAWDTGHDKAMEAGGREFDPRLGHYSRMSF